MYKVAQILPKHWEYSSLLTGQIPVSLACRCWRRVSSCSCKFSTSKRVAGVLDTHCCHSCPLSLHCRGGRMELRISSVDFELLSVVSFTLGGLGIGPPLPITATVGCCPTLGVVTLNKKSSTKMIVYKKWYLGSPLGCLANKYRIIILEERRCRCYHTHPDHLLVSLVARQPHTIWIFCTQRPCSSILKTSTKHTPALLVVS